MHGDGDGGKMGGDKVARVFWDNVCGRNCSGCELHGGRGRGGGPEGTTQVGESKRGEDPGGAGRARGSGRAAWRWQGGVRATRQGRADGRAACGRQSGGRAARDEGLEAEWR